jgi:hypothetical protein
MPGGIRPLASPASAEKLEEQRDAQPHAAVPDVMDPVEVQRPVARATLPTDDAPVDSREVEARHRPQQRLQRQEPDRGGDGPQGVGAAYVVVVLDRGAKPHVAKRPRAIRSTSRPGGASGCDPEPGCGNECRQVPATAAARAVQDLGVALRPLGQHL